MWNSSDQHFTKTYVDKTSVSFVALPVFWHEKSFQKPLENNCDGVLFQWSCRLWGNLRKDFIIVSFGWIFLWNFSDQLFSKIASGESFWKTLWDFASALEEVIVFVQVDFDTYPLAFIQNPEVQMWSDICRIQ